MKKRTLVKSVLLALVCVSALSCAEENHDCFDLFVTSYDPWGKQVESRIGSIEIDRDDFTLSLAPGDTAIRLSRCKALKENEL